MTFVEDVFPFEENSVSQYIQPIPFPMQQPNPDLVLDDIFQDMTTLDTTHTPSTTSDPATSPQNVSVHDPDSITGHLRRSTKQHS